jgi:hypothetical protein
MPLTLLKASVAKPSRAQEKVQALRRFRSETGSRVTHSRNHLASNFVQTAIMKIETWREPTAIAAGSFSSAKAFPQPS